MAEIRRIRTFISKRWPGIKWDTEFTVWAVKETPDSDVSFRFSMRDLVEFKESKFKPGGVSSGILALMGHNEPEYVITKDAFNKIGPDNVNR